METLDYVEFELLDEHWKGYVTYYDDEKIIVQASGSFFRLRIINKAEDRYIWKTTALIDRGDWYPERTASWESKSTPLEKTATFFLKKKRWGYWVWILAIILYFVK